MNAPTFMAITTAEKMLKNAAFLAPARLQTTGKADLCKSCPVPGIKRANACPTLELTATIKKGPMGKKRQVKVAAFCTRSHTDVLVPEVGCGICHPVSEIFTIKPE